MIKVVIFLFTISFCFSSIDLELNFRNEKIKQGELAEAQVSTTAMLDPGFYESLRNKNIGSSLYFFEVDEKKAKVVIYKIPETRTIKEIFNNVELNVTLSNLNITPVEEQQSLLFGDFEIPKSNKMGPWIIAFVLIILVLGYLYLKFQKKAKRRKEKLEFANRLRDELVGVKNYEEVVNLWKKKKIYFDNFEHVREPFQKFEVVLNKYQFRPQQTETEKIEVMEAYRKFSRSVEGGFHGV